MSNKISSRMEYWSEYREKINEKSRKFEHPLDSKGLSRIVKEIKNINPKILDDFKIKPIEIPQLIKIKDDQENYFDSIAFKIDNFDHTITKKIDNELKFASNSIVSNIALNDDNLVDVASIDKSDSIHKLNEIKNMIIDAEKIIQVFPKESKKDLEKLNSLVKTVKNNTKEQQLEEINFDQKDPCEKNKKIYLSLLFSVIGIMVIIFILLLIFIIL